LAIKGASQSGAHPGFVSGGRRYHRKIRNMLTARYDVTQGASENKFRNWELRIWGKLFFLCLGGGPGAGAWG